MKIEKITENKIRFILSNDDLKEKNINSHEFMANSIETQDMFLNMLDEAEKQIGFSTKNYKLLLEAIATIDGTFILTVTRISPESDKSHSKSIKIQRKFYTPAQGICTYKFTSFDTFCDFSNRLIYSQLSVLKNKLKNSVLYEYNSAYYLVLHCSSIKLANFKSLHLLISEFASLSSTTNIFESKLKECGKVIFPKDAINLCAKFFIS